MYAGMISRAENDIGGIKDNFGFFIEQHKVVVENCTKEQFAAQDEYLSKMEGIYQHVVLCLRKLIHDAEIKEQLSRIKANEEQKKRRKRAECAENRNEFLRFEIRRHCNNKNEQ